jgi:hypothetical protein
MPQIPALTSFTASTLAQAAQVNSNFSNVRTYVNTYGVFTDVASQIITKTLTFTPDSGAAITVTTGGITITAGGLTVTAGNVVATAGNVTVTAGNLTFGAASAKIIPGATSLLFRDNGDANTNLSITDAGAVTIRAGLTVTAGGLTVSSGTTAVQALTATTVSPSTNLNFSAASGKILVGATNLLFRNAADSATRMEIQDGGGVRIGASGTGVDLNYGATSLILTHATGPIVIGSTVATSATVNMPLIANCAGTPTGAVSDGSMILDTTNHRIYFRSGSAWKYAALT